MKRATTLAAALTLAGTLTLGACTKDEGPRSTLTADQAKSMRAACAFKAGQTAGLTQAKDAPLGDEIPINTIIIMMMENRSFDHLLGALPKFGQTDVDVAPDGVTNPDSSGNPIARFHNPSYCFADTNHSWSGAHTEYDGGKNDGFVLANESMPGAGDGVRAMGWYDGTDLPWIYAAAGAWAISDRHFSSILGPTFPNREYLYAATSYGETDNVVFETTSPLNIMSNIENVNAGIKDTKQQVTWGIYYEAIPNLGIFLNTLVMYLDHVNSLNEFYSDAAAGNLPNIVFVDPDTRNEYGAGDDDHPPSDPQKADQLMAKIVTAVTTSPQWAHTALIITFDENGGLYDHVAPPAACAPDNLAPKVPAGDTQYDFKRYGFRVPLIVVSPYAKKHYVSHAVTDHTSIIRFVEQRFKLPAMSARDANADPLSDIFDFDKADTSVPSLPAAPLDNGKLSDCAAQFPDNPPSTIPGLDGGVPDGGP
jgi:phospholipase C